MDRSFAHNPALSRGCEELCRKGNADAIHMRPPFTEGHSR